MLSIIIPAFNQHEATKQCLEAIHETTSNVDIVLIDNGSNPALEASAIRNEKNMGFPIAVNQGIRVAKGDIICLLNNDVIVTPGWSEKMISGLDKYAIVGPMTNYCTGIQRMGMPVYYDKSELYRVASEWGDKRFGMNLSVNWIIGFCFMFRKSLYDQIGEFDESLWPCSGEEIDFCLRARAKGHKVGVIQDAYVHHEGSATFRTLDEDYNAIVERNNKHLADKWGKDFCSKQLIPIGRENTDGLRLNLGCGKFHLTGFVNIDQLDRVQPEVKSDIFHLPYDSETVDEIYAGHLLEHLSSADGMKALYYWHSLLRVGGTISISVPDYDYLARDFVKTPTADKLREMNDLYIYSECQESPHLYMYNGPLLKQVMAEAGFVDLKQMPVNHPYFPLPVKWQVGYEGKKVASA
jgi:GT2 family glycosyltransferase